MPEDLICRAPSREEIEHAAVSRLMSLPERFEVSAIIQRKGGDKTRVSCSARRVDDRIEVDFSVLPPLLDGDTLTLEWP